MSDTTEGISSSALTTGEIAVAKQFALEKPSTSYLQRRMGIPYSHAKRLMASLEADGIVSAANSAGKRTVILTGNG